MIENYHIKVAEEDIQLLKDKIKLTRLPDEINHKWTFGTDKTFLKDLLNTWSNDFDWRIHENKINEIGSYRFTSKSGLKIHFIHSKSGKKNALPIVMTHGWPGAFKSF